MDNDNEITLEIDNNKPVYSIGVVADLLDISVHTIRLYENEGLIIPYKKDSKHRLYSQNDVLRLKCIMDLIREKKFSIAAIKAFYSLIPCWKIVNCKTAQRNACEAYHGYLLPCWTYKHKGNICALQECNQCKVYTEHFRCESIKATIKNVSCGLD